MKINVWYDTNFIMLIISSIPDFNEVDLTKLQIDKKWPAKHPYSSHIPSVRMFPSYDSPDDSASATHQSSTLPPTVPAAAHPPTVVGKTKGSFARHEVIKIPLDSERKPISWPDGPDYYQVILTLVHLLYFLY